MTALDVVQDDTMCRMLDTAFHTPGTSAYDHATIEQILKTPIDEQTVLVNVTVIIADIGRVKEMRTKDGRSCQCLELKVTDKSIKIMSFVIWDSAVQKLSANWIPLRTSK